MLVSDFDFDLPPDAIALRPAEPRDAARLLVVRPDGSLEDRRVRDLAELLAPGDALVFNDTRVIPAELAGIRSRPGVDGPLTAHVTFTLLKREGPDRWRAFARPGKRLKPGDRVRFGTENPACALGHADATVIDKAEDGQITLAFDLSGPDLDAVILAVGAMPLPPYISARRATDARDKADYQTIYARDDGAVAAPTAGLHFTPDLFRRLDERGIARHFVTLHVGAGTFLPMKVEAIADHVMHAEWGAVDAATADALNAVRARGGRIVAVGTTSARLLESATGADRVIRPFSGDTAIFITPGYRFNAVDALMSNFHLPKSTLMMLVSALAGLDTMKRAYAHAVATGYRFYSYGDASLLFPPETAR
ncbi:MAG: tRNA preQ1(34) S-adenosylmethionine ribosyltransferase-isomerase QueA [Hyphomicrobiaceae bacterium]|nr:tRNA preQ1(34) S-adenosylmethionine ribosyltransferase-isomerase QueA [Hyphomicrobiaceae bacterium]